MPECDTMKCFLTENGIPMSLFESYEQLEWTRNLYRPGTLKMTINRYVDNANKLEPGLEFLIMNDPNEDAPDILYTIEQVEREQNLSGRAGDKVNITAKEYGFFDERICLPPPFDIPFSVTQSHHTINGPAETAMKNLVSYNVGPNAPVNRKLSKLLIEIDQGRGEVREYKARFEKLSDKLEEIGLLSNLGWEVRYNNNNFIFTIIPEIDKTDTVIFDRQFDNISGATWLWSFSDLRNIAYVAGQGEGTSRLIEKVFLDTTEPSDFDRREIFIDARDLNISADLITRGIEQLSAQTIEDLFDIEINTQSNFKYLEHWDLGNLVTVRSREWGLNRIAKIVEIKNIIRNNYGAIERTISLGKTFPTLKDRITREIGNDGTRRQ